MLPKRVAIVQSSYIPWKGYFDLIHSVDEFILFDDAQYTRRDWRNRNRIKTPTGPSWLTIPVLNRGRYEDPISSMCVSSEQWTTKHWRTIVANYARARHFKTYETRLKDLYLGCQETRLSLINHRFIKGICDILGIRTRLSWSSDYELTAGKTERIVSICRQAEATVYVSGPSAADYLEERQFSCANMQLSYFSYAGYPDYEQLFPPFEHRVSVLDLILNHGPDAPRYMLSF